jgi:hypothetical protein
VRSSPNGRRLPGHKKFDDPVKVSAIRLAFVPRTCRWAAIFNSGRFSSPPSGLRRGFASRPRAGAWFPGVLVCLAVNALQRS